MGLTPSLDCSLASHPPPYHWGSALGRVIYWWWQLSMCLFRRYPLFQFWSSSLIINLLLMVVAIVNVLVQAVPSLPVLVFLHGGGYVSGSGSRLLYGPELFMDREVNQSWDLSRPSCKIFANCVSFPGKQRDFMHNMRRSTRFTHTMCDFALKLLKLYTLSQILTKKLLKYLMLMHLCCFFFNKDSRNVRTFSV